MELRHSGRVVETQIGEPGFESLHPCQAGIKKQNGFWKKTNFPLTLRWGVEQIRYNWSTRPRPSPPLPPSARSPRPSSSCAGSSAPSGAPPPRSARCRLRQTSCKANQGSSVDDQGSCSRWKEPFSLIHDPDVLESNNRGRATCIRQVKDELRKVNAGIKV